MILNTVKLNFLLGLAFLFLFISCKKIESSVQNKNFKLEFLFEKNGCKMYRFKDGERYVYWSDCQGKTQYNETKVTGNIISSRNFESTTSK